MRPLVTLVNHSCAKGCHHCSYGDPQGVAFGQLTTVVHQLVAAGHPVHLYDMHVTARSLELYRLTRQFERPNPGWLNVNPDFDPTADDVAYLNTLQTALVISLHGATPATHALLAGSEKDFADVCLAIRRLGRTIRLPFGINYVVHRHNIAEIPDFIRFAIQDLGVSFVEFINLGYGGQAPSVLGADYALDRESFLDAYLVLRREWRRYGDFVQFDSQWGPDFLGTTPEACRLFAAPVPDRFCNAGINHLALRADNLGVWACPTLVTFPELRMGTFADGEIVLDGPERADLKPTAAPCVGCQHEHACQGGPRCIAIGDAVLHTGRADSRAAFESCLFQSYRQGRFELSGTRRRRSE